MPESDDAQRFDALLDAMLTKPPLEYGADQQDGDEDLRDSQDD